MRVKVHGLADSLASLHPESRLRGVRVEGRLVRLIFDSLVLGTA
jgi:hypothetical protein